MFKKNPNKALIQRAKALLASAKKVLNYRKEDLPEGVQESLTLKIVELKAFLKAHKGRFTEASLDELSLKLEALEILLKNYGGKIYPHRAITENIEIAIITVFLVFSLRVFFFQPFKIPTNSMWPTYAGMHEYVYSKGRSNAPSKLEQFRNTLFYGAKHYSRYARQGGELVIPVEKFEVNGVVEVRLFSRPVEVRRLFGILNAIQNQYLFRIGTEVVTFEVPVDFDFNALFLKLYFPEHKDFQTYFKDRLANGAVVKNKRVNHEGKQYEVYNIYTGLYLNEGEDFLKFDIRSGSMLFINRMLYHFRPPRIGEAVVFRTDPIPGLRIKGGFEDDVIWQPDRRYYIKRLVGYGLDTLNVKNGALFRNNLPIVGSEIFHYNALRIKGYGGYGADWRLAEGRQDSLKKEGYYYVIGDNSPLSYDSRAWSINFARQYIEKRTEAEIKKAIPENGVPKKALIGKASFIFYPFDVRFGRAH